MIKQPLDTLNNSGVHYVQGPVTGRLPGLSHQVPVNECDGNGTMPADPSEAARQPASSTRTHSEESSQSRNHKTATDDCRLQYDRVSEIICPPPDHGRSPALTSRSDFRIDVEQAPTIGARGFLEGHSSLFRAAFIVTALSTQVLSQGQFGMVIVPLYAIGEWLGTTDPGQLSWMAASNGLTVGMFLVMSGRLGDIVSVSHVRPNQADKPQRSKTDVGNWDSHHGRLECGFGMCAQPNCLRHCASRCWNRRCLLR